MIMQKMAGIAWPGTRRSRLQMLKNINKNAEVYLRMSICGIDCCSKCSKNAECGGCEKSSGHPFGGTCVAAEAFKQGGPEEFLRLKNQLINEFNMLKIKGLKVEELNLLNGDYVNLEYPLPNGLSVKLLKDNNIYWGNQIEIEGSSRCYGIVADSSIMLVCQYGCNGESPEIILYKKRKTSF